MSLADDLDQAAQSLRQLAGKYTTTSSTFSQQAQGLQGVVETLTSGSSRWAGNSSLAFQLSWNRTSQDSKNVQSALTSAAGLMTSLASTLEANAPTIRNAQSIQQNAPFMPQTTQQEVSDVQKMVQQAVQQEQNALAVITMMVSQLADKLDEAAQEVGFCSTGQDEKQKGNSPFENVFYSDNGDGSPGGDDGGQGDKPADTLPDGWQIIPPEVDTDHPDIPTYTPLVEMFTADNGLEVNLYPEDKELQVSWINQFRQLLSLRSLVEYLGERVQVIKAYVTDAFRAQYFATPELEAATMQRLNVMAAAIGFKGVAIHNDNIIYVIFTRIK